MSSNDQPIPHTNLDHVRMVEENLERRSDPNATWGPINEPGWRPLCPSPPQGRGQYRTLRFPEHTSQQ